MFSASLASSSSLHARRRSWPRSGAAAAAASRAAPAAVPPALVTNQEISRACRPTASRWLTFGGNYSQPSLQPADADHARERQRAWSRSGRSRPATLGNFQTTSLLRDNVLYVTGPQNVAWAIDARTGRQIWRYRRELPAGLTACCGLVNRGFGVLGDKLFMTTLDAHLLALDMKTGAIVWDATLEDLQERLCRDHRPARRQGQGHRRVAGGEYGIRGFIDAYDAQTGKRAWRFYTIPGPGEPGNDTWAGDSWQRGGIEHLGDRRLRSRAEPGLLRHRQSRTRLSQREPRRATTCTAIRWSRSTPTPASSAGTTSSRRTTCTTGMRRRCRSWPT